MSGYRQHSYDPNAYQQPGAPLKPYNWVQWSGLAIGGVGALLVTLDVLAKVGWTPRWFGDLSPLPFILLIAGTVLINSRRQPSTEVGSEQLAKNRRLLLITSVICVALLGAAALIELQGA